jgi:hypothetical protein
METWIWIVLVPAWLALMMAILALLSWASGWRALARRYRGDAIPDGLQFSMQWVRVGWVDYNGCVTYRVCPQGLYVALWRFFRFMHPPLLIPWSALHVLQVRSNGWIKHATVAVDRPPIARLRLPLRVAEAVGELLPHAGESSSPGTD